MGVPFLRSVAREVTELIKELTSRRKLGKENYLMFFRRTNWLKAWSQYDYDDRSLLGGSSTRNKARSK